MKKLLNPKSLRLQKRTISNLSNSKIDLAENPTLHNDCNLYSYYTVCDHCDLNISNNTCSKRKTCSPTFGLLCRGE